jgi:hypothetical protein
MNKSSLSTAVQPTPWYRQFWPWFIIALPATVVVASFFTLWIAISNPDHLVVSDGEYQEIRSELKAGTAARDGKQDQAETDTDAN